MIFLLLDVSFWLVKTTLSSTYSLCVWAFAKEAKDDRLEQALIELDTLKKQVQQLNSVSGKNLIQEEEKT